MFMTATPAGIINQAQNFFLSEDFIRGFEIIRGCFGEDVSDETILQLLKGEIGFRVVRVVDDEDDSLFLDDIQFDKEFVNEDYAQEVSEVLSSYDNVLEIDGEHYEVSEMQDFVLTQFAPISDFVKYLNENKETLIASNDFKYKKQMSEYGVRGFDLCDYFYYNDNGIYFFNEFSKSNIEGITVIKKNVSDVIAKFDERGY